MIRALAVILLGFTASAYAETRYVVASTIYGMTSKTYPVWTSNSFAEGCTSATISRDPKAIREFCTDGFAGIKPKVGTAAVGDTVEKLDGGHCGDMVSIRTSAGDIGCIVGSALSSAPPSAPATGNGQAASAAAAPSAAGEMPTKWRTAGGGVYIGSNPPAGSSPLR